MKKVRVSDYPKEYFNIVDEDENGYFVFGEIIEVSEDSVCINHPDYNHVSYPKELIIWDE